jgi:hypothetical protein
MSVYRVGEKFRVCFGTDKNGWKLTRICAVYRCDCGERFIMQCRSESVTQSCGCLVKERARQLLTKNTYRRTHNKTTSRTYKTWSKMRSRCSNPSDIEYPRYGARGITVCERWMSSFEAFVADMGERPEGMTLDRVDSNGNYDPQNCRWATPKQQARNKRNNVIITIDGISKTAVEWSEHPKAAKDKLIYQRLKNGWNAKEAVFG